MSFSEITTRLPIYLTKVGEKAFVFAIGRLRENFDANILLVKEIPRSFNSTKSRDELYYLLHENRMSRFVSI
jgi:hypothetical protein